jgi:hypothetical protein
VTGRIKGAVPLERRMKCLLTVGRFSRRFLEALDEETQFSSGFFETLFPSVAVAHDLTLAELPDSSKGYVESALPGPGEVPTLQEVLAAYRTPADDGHLYHPIKD